MARRDRYAREDGAAATEFAIIVPLLILLFFGIVYFGLYIYRGQVLESAAREGGRVASVGGTTAEIQSAVTTAAGVTFRASELSFPTVGTCSSVGDTVTVEVRASGSRLDFTVPFYSGGTVSPVFSATATFECEKVAS